MDFTPNAIPTGKEYLFEGEGAPAARARAGVATPAAFPVETPPQAQEAAQRQLAVLQYEAQDPAVAADPSHQAERARAAALSGGKAADLQALNLEAPKPVAPPTWDEVTRLPEMQRLKPDDLEAARNQYFADVVAPQVPTEQLPAARSAFDADTNPGPLHRALHSLRDTVASIREKTAEAMAAGGIDDPYSGPDNMPPMDGIDKLATALRPSDRSGQDARIQARQADRFASENERVQRLARINAEPGVRQIASNMRFANIEADRDGKPRPYADDQIKRIESQMNPVSGFGDQGERKLNAEASAGREKYASDFWNNVAGFSKTLEPQGRMVMGGLLRSVGEALNAELDKPGTGEALDENLTGQVSDTRKRAIELTRIGTDFYDAGDFMSKDAMKGLKPGIGATAIGSAMQSVSQMIVPVLAGALTGGAGSTLALMGVNTFGQQYGQGRQEGLTPAQSAVYAGIYSVIEVGTEFAPAKALMAKSPHTAAWFWNFLAREVPSEMLATTLQSALDKVSVTPEMTWGDFQDAMLTTILSTPVAAGGQAGALHVATGSPGGLSEEQRAQILEKYKTEFDAFQKASGETGAFTTRSPADAAAAAAPAGPAGPAALPAPVIRSEANAAPDFEAQQRSDAARANADAVYAARDAEEKRLAALKEPQSPAAAAAPVQGADHAGAIRSDEGKVPEGRNERGGGQDQGRADLQRQAEAGAAAGDAQLRRGGDGEARAGEVDAAAHEAATSTKNELEPPTQAQIEAGNYQKGHARIAGMDISIENPEGSKRRPEWPTLQHHYGYIRGTIGADKDHVDVFIKPGTKSDFTGDAYVVNQTRKDGSFDEHKVMLGYASEKEAREAYLSNYSKGWNGAGSIVALPLPQFKIWAADKSKDGPKAGALRPFEFNGKSIDRMTRSDLEFASRNARTRARREIAVAELDRRRVAETIQVPENAHELLRIMGKNAGHLEVGGRAIRRHDVRGKQYQHEVIGRTSWQGQPEWAAGSGLSQVGIEAAVEKSIAGERLGPREHAVVTAMLAELAETQKALEDAGASEEEARQAASAIENESTPDTWSTMSDGEKDDYLDNLFGPETAAAKSEGAGAEKTPREVRSPGAQESVATQAGALSIEPEPIEKSSAAPHRPPNARWYSDRGAIPGEPMLLLDAKDGDLDSAKAAIIEREIPGKGVLYDAMDSEGELLGTAETVDQAAAIAEKAFPERRADSAKRKKVAEMSPAEMGKALLTDPLTGIGNRRAYDESQKLPVQVSIDLDSLKWVNDNLGHAAGDELIKALGTALGDESVSAYRVGGDEFALQALTPEEAAAAVDALQARLAGAELTFRLRDGRNLTKKGVDFSHGIGSTLEEADAQLRSSKERREAAGERARRGEAPPGVTVGPATGREARASEAAAQDVTNGGRREPAFARVGNIQSAEFKKWFGDSKVVDDAGRPLVVYHGTNDKFNVFDFSRVGDKRLEGGFFFAENDMVAQDYGDVMVRAYLSIQNPFVTSYKAWMNHDIYRQEDTVADLKKRGHDGVIIEDAPADPNDEIMEDRGRWFIAFKPTQIKSVNNRGTFDPKNPDIRFARGAAGGGMPIEKVQAEADRLTKDWANAPKMTVLANPAAAPFKAPKDALGAYWNDTMYLFASNLKSIDQVQYTVFHEILGHHGLRGFFGNAEDKVLNGLALRNKAVRAAAAAWRDANPKPKDSTEADYRTLSIEEALSDMAGRGVAVSELGGFSKIVASLVRWLRANGFNKVADWLAQLKPGDLNNILAQARAYVTDVARPHVFTPQDLAPAFHTPPAKPFADAVKEIVTGKGDRREALSVSDTPPVLRLLGMRQQRIVLGGHTIDKVLYDHGVPMPVVQRLPELIANPVLVFESDTVPGDWVIVTNEKVKGLPLVVTLRPDGDINREVVNVITSAYPRNKPGEAFNRWVKGDLLAYVNEAMRPEWQRSLGLRLPGKMPTRGAGKRLLTQTDLVNAAGGETPGTKEAPAFARASALTPAAAAKVKQTTYSKIANAVIDGIDRTLDPILGLPDHEAFLKLRYKAQGHVDNVNDIARSIYSTFSKASAADAKASFEYLTTKGAKPDGIKDQAVRDHAVKTKDMIDQVGLALVKHGLLQEGTFEENRGAYLPRIYLKHLLDEKDWGRVGTGRKPSQMGYLKQRKDIPSEVREVLMGEVKDPGYLAAVGFTRAMRDINLLEWLHGISKHQQWVLPKSLVDFNGQRVTPYWLKAEAARLRLQAEHQDAPIAKKAKDAADAMDKAATPALAGMEYEEKEWKQMPDTPRYGRLRGVVVRKEIYDDIVGIGAMVPKDAGWAEKLLGYGGIGTKATQLWKASKVSLNPPSQVRNFVSNAVLLHISGVPMVMIPVRLAQAAKAMRTDGAAWQIAKKNGIKANTFSATELTRIETAMLDVKAKESGSVLARLGSLAGKGFNAAGDVYQLMESLFKTAKIIDDMAGGAKAEDAVLEANKWLFDYSRVAPSVRYLRNAPIGAPFLTFMVKVAPRLVEVGLKHPHRYLPYIIASYAIPYAVASMLGVGKDDLERLKKLLPDAWKTKGHVYVLPYKDRYGRWQVLDLSYFLPWAQFDQAGRQLVDGDVIGATKTLGIFGGPIPDIITAWKTNKDPFTGRDIVPKGSPPSLQIGALLTYAMNMALPPWLTSNGMVGVDLGDPAGMFSGKLARAIEGKTNKYGDPVTTPAQAALSMVGVNMRGVDPKVDRNTLLQHAQRGIADTRTELKRSMEDRALSPAERARIQGVYVDEMKRRHDKLKTLAEETKLPRELQ